MLCVFVYNYQEIGIALLALHKEEHRERSEQQWNDAIQKYCF